MNGERLRYPWGLTTMAFRPSSPEIKLLSASSLLMSKGSLVYIVNNRNKIIYNANIYKIATYKINIYQYIHIYTFFFFFLPLAPGHLGKLCD